MRRHTRYRTRLALTLVDDQGASWPSWTVDISKAGLHAVEVTSFEVGARIEVRIDAAGERLAVPARVVWKRAAAAGIEFGELCAAKRRALDRLVDGIAEDESRAINALSDSVVQLRHFIAGLDASDLYGAIGARSTAPVEGVCACIEALRRNLSAARSEISPPQQVRIDRALDQLLRVERLMKDPQARLEYDFRAGHVRAEERISNAGKGEAPSISALQATWVRLFPKRRTASRERSSAAFIEKKRGETVAALRLLQSAIDLDPFDPELRRIWAAWLNPPRSMTMNDR